MGANECLNTLRKIKDAAFATVDAQGRPQVRIIDVMLVEDNKLYFVTARGKAFYRELMADARLAVTALTSDYKMIRLTGRAEAVDSDKKNWIDRVFEENPSMNGVYPGDARYILEPFCISRAEIEYFDLSQEPIFRESYSIGGEQTTVKGYEIGPGCTLCGVCAGICPQKCIAGGEAYRIEQRHCLHCGLCFENCPSDAIIHRG